ncbi:uncharacterized protein ACR2FA_004557 [Aphomia sociella]
MSSDKLSSDEVPQKFAEWLLTMGCPPDVVPSVEKVAEMCRGQYYMVWRSLMEHVKPKDSIKQKRLQVFCDDIKRWQKKSPFSEHDTKAVMPEELHLWHQQTELKNKVEAAENQSAHARSNLNQLNDKLSMKMSQRNISLRRLQNAQRRVWLLQQVAQELKAKKVNLQETKTIADSLCSFDEESNIPDKLEKCMNLVRQQGQGQPPSASYSLLSTANPAACSSVVSTQGDSADTEEQVSSLVRCGGTLWPRLSSRRASLASALAASSPTPPRRPGTTAQSVLAHTAALHCTLGIESMKNRIHIEQTQKRFVEALTDLNNYLSSPEEHELAVVRCELANVSGRVAATKALMSRLETCSGDFAISPSVPSSAPGTPAAALLPGIDRNIESKREELKRLLATLAATEKKISNIRDCLVNIFGGFHKDLRHDNDKYKNFLDIPQESIASLRQFYEARRERRKNKMELSLDLDVSDSCSFTMATENNNPVFTDELKIYLKKFKLENNRKLVLESGEKIWIFEGLQSAISRLHTKWQNSEISCSLVCPSVTLACNLRQLVDSLHNKEVLEAMLRGMEDTRKLDINIDISSKTKEEGQTIDKIKKRLNENLIGLQKTSKTLELGMDNLKFWSGNRIKEHISTNRKCNDRIYKDYECLYIEKLGLNII